MGDCNCGFQKGRPHPRDVHVRAGRIGGPTGGRMQGPRNSRSGKIAAETGQLAAARARAQETFRLHPEILRESGLRADHSRAGRANVESGELFRARQRIKRKDTKPESALKAKLDELVAVGAIGAYEHPWVLNGKFVVDFLVPEWNTIIEVNGCYWHGCSACGFSGTPKNRMTDPGRYAYIRACGYGLEIIMEHELLGG